MPATCSKRELPLDDDHDHDAAVSTNPNAAQRLKIEIVPPLAEPDPTPPPILEGSVEEAAAAIEGILSPPENNNYINNHNHDYENNDTNKITNDNNDHPTREEPIAGSTVADDERGTASDGVVTQSLLKTEEIVVTQPLPEDGDIMDEVDDEDGGGGDEEPDRPRESARVRASFGDEGEDSCSVA